MKQDNNDPQISSFKPVYKRFIASFWLGEKYYGSEKIDKLFLFRKEAASPLAGFHSSPLLWLDRDLETLIVLQREENQRTQRKIVWATQPSTYGTGPALNQDYIG